MSHHASPLMRFTLQALAMTAKLGFACLVLLLIGGCAETSPPTIHKPQVNSYQSGRKVYFSMRDPRGDDKGPGTYLYPLRFDNREGFFDIEKFQVEDGGANIVFRVTTRRPIQKFRPDGSSEAKGWFLQLLDIYIDKDHKTGSGVTRTLPGRFVEFAEDSAWEQVLLVTPNRTQDVRRLIEARTNDMGLVHLKPKILIPQTIFIEGFDFIVQVPKALIGEPQPTWGYQCLMMQFEPRNLGNFEFQNAKIYKFPTDTNFGGGSDFFGNPGVLDLLAPTEDEQSQWLGAYDPSPNPEDSELATVHCMYADVQASPPVILSSRGPRATAALGSPPLRPGPPKSGTLARRPTVRRPGPASKYAERKHLRAPEANGLDELPQTRLMAPTKVPAPSTKRSKTANPELLVAPGPGRSTRSRPPAGPPPVKYRTETFSSDADDLFVNHPRSR